MSKLEPSPAKTVFSSESRVTLGFIWQFIAFISPVISLLLLQYREQQLLRGKIEVMSSNFTAIQLQINDRWTRSMMVLFATELELRNRDASNKLEVPNPEEIARRVPLNYLH